MQLWLLGAQHEVQTHDARQARPGSALQPLWWSRTCRTLGLSTRARGGVGRSRKSCMPCDLYGAVGKTKSPSTRESSNMLARMSSEVPETSEKADQRHAAACRVSSPGRQLLSCLWNWAKAGRRFLRARGAKLPHLSQVCGRVGTRLLAEGLVVTRPNSQPRNFGEGEQVRVALPNSSAAAASTCPLKDGCAEQLFSPWIWASFLA